MKPPYEASDKVFGGERLDAKKIDNAEFTHCVFANLSFKEAALANGRFVDCVFINCYFRKATLSGTRFIGCKFIDCDFPKVAIRGCDFRYARFSGCWIAYGEIEHSLPSEPNLREALARNLALETARLGLGGDARRFRMCEIRAREQHLAAAVRAESEWYESHYPGSRRVGAAFDLFSSMINRWLWGYGERSIVILRNLFLAGVVLFPALFYLLRNQFEFSADRSSRVGVAVGFWDVLRFSVDRIVPAGVGSGVIPSGSLVQLLTLVETVFALVSAGLLVTYVLRWSLRK